MIKCWKTYKNKIDCIIWTSILVTHFIAAQIRLQITRSRLVEEHVASRFLLQKRKISHISNDDHSESLHMAVQRQDDTVHGKVDFEAFMRHELPHLSSRHARMQTANGKSWVFLSFHCINIVDDKKPEITNWRQNKNTLMLSWTTLVDALRFLHFKRSRIIMTRAFAYFTLFSAQKWRRE